MKEQITLALDVGWSGSVVVPASHLAPDPAWCSGQGAGETRALETELEGERQQRQRGHRHVRQQHAADVVDAQTTGVAHAGSCLRCTMTIGEPPSGPPVL